MLRTLHGLLTAAELLRVRFHDLRHSAASLLIAAGVELVEVSMCYSVIPSCESPPTVLTLAEADGGEGCRHMDAALAR